MYCFSFLRTYDEDNTNVSLWNNRFSNGKNNTKSNRRINSKNDHKSDRSSNSCNNFKSYYSNI